MPAESNVRPDLTSNKTTLQTKRLHQNPQANRGVLIIEEYNQWFTMKDYTYLYQSLEVEG
jgi:hypothetical protein